MVARVISMRWLVVVVLLICSMSTISVVMASEISLKGIVSAEGDQFLLNAEDGEQYVLEGEDVVDYVDKSVEVVGDLNEMDGKKVIEVIDIQESK